MGTGMDIFMQSKKCRIASRRMLLLAASGLIGVTESALAQACEPILAAGRQHLSEVIRAKYHVPNSMTVIMDDQAFVGETCYRRLDFHSAGGVPRPFLVRVFASPDLRFLFSDLLDTTLALEEDVRQYRHDFLSDLASGSYPSRGLRTASVTLTIFADFECQYCAQAGLKMATLVPSTEEDNVRLVFRHFPLLMDS